MHMNNFTGCCEQCFEIIGKKNTNAARIWMDLCSYKIKKNIKLIFIESPGIPEIRTLEMLGFLVSTEIEKYIALKMHGCSNSTNSFCIKGSLHD